MTLRVFHAQIICDRCGHILTRQCNLDSGGFSASDWCRELDTEEFWDIALPGPGGHFYDYCPRCVPRAPGKDWWEE